MYARFQIHVYVCTRMYVFRYERKGLQVLITPAAWMSQLDVVCCQVVVFSTSLSLVQRSPTKWDVSNLILDKQQDLAKGSVAPLETKIQWVL
jgi:hypothetical protein